MITKDTKAYLSCNFEGLLKTITELSESIPGKSLVEDERNMYDFDIITEKIFGQKNPPNSADALYVTNKQILFTEFKSGFVKKINTINFDYSKIDCPDDTGKVCMPYAKLFIDKQNMENGELLDSLKMKALESYITLEKKILPLCEDKTLGKAVRCVFSVVVDAPNDTEEDILGELAGSIANSTSNVVTQVKQSLERFAHNKDAEAKDYLYDEVKVFSPYEYQQYLNKVFV